MVPSSWNSQKVRFHWDQCVISFWCCFLWNHNIEKNHTFCVECQFHKRAYCTVLMYVLLTTDVFGWPQPTCQFPEWLNRHTWQDLANSHLFIPAPSGMTVSVTYRHYSHSIPRDRYAIRCSRVQQEDSAPNQFTAVSYTSDDWYRLFVNLLNSYQYKLHLNKFCRSVSSSCHWISQVREG